MCNFYWRVDETFSKDVDTFTIVRSRKKAGISDCDKKPLMEFKNNNRKINIQL